MPSGEKGCGCVKKYFWHGQGCRGTDLRGVLGTQEKWKEQVSRKYELDFLHSQFLFSLVPQGEWCTGKWIMIYFSDSYILIMFFLLPYDQSHVSSHSCLDTHNLGIGFPKMRSLVL